MNEKAKDKVKDEMACDELLVYVEGGVWRTPPVVEEPVIPLARWSIWEVLSDFSCAFRHDDLLLEGEVKFRRQKGFFF